MPKDIYEIRAFTSGLMSAPSESDIPDDAASYSLNIDPSVEDGKLGGIPTDVEYSLVGQEFYARKMTEIEYYHEGDSRPKTTLVYFDHSVNRIKYIDNFYYETSPYTAEQSEEIAASPYLTFSPYNHAVHIGLGPSVEPKWFGYLSHGQDGSTVPPSPTPYLTSAKLEKIAGGDTTPDGMYKSVIINDGATEYMVGFIYGRDRLFAINIADGTTYSYSTQNNDLLPFVKLQAICDCIDDTVTGYGQCFYVYDKDSSEYGTVYRIKFDPTGTPKWTIDATISVSNFDKGLEDPNTYELTDMEQSKYEDGTTNKFYFWFAFHNTAGPVRVCKHRSGDPNEISSLTAENSVGYPTLLFMSNEYSWSGVTALTMKNMTPSLRLKNANRDTCEKGQFCHSDNIGAYHYFEFNTFMKPLCKTGDLNGDIAYFFNCREGNIGPKIKVSSPDDNNWSHIGLACYIVGVSNTPGGNCLPDTNANVRIRGVQTGREEFDGSGTNVYNRSISGFQAIYLGDNILVSISTPNMTTMYLYATTAFTLSSVSFGAFYYYPTNPGGEIESSRTYGFRYLENGTTWTPYGTDVTAYKHTEGDSVVVTIGNGSIINTPDEIVVCKDNGGFQLSKLSYTADTTPNGDEFGSPTNIVNGDLVIVPRLTSSAAPGMRRDREYRYYLAYEYDKSQIGPLSDILQSITLDDDEKAIFVEIYFKSSLLLNQRISGLYLFRGYADGFIDPDQGSTPKMLKYFDLTKSIARKVLEGTSEEYLFLMAKDADSLGATYDTLTGYMSTESQCTPNYSISCVGQSYNFVSGCGGLDGFNDATNYVFRSQPGRFDQFNIVEDFVILPETPKAMVFFNGKLYCFSTTRSWVINALGDMYIEDQLEGIGCQSNESLTVTDAGLFVAGESNVYINVGNGFQAIGDPILRSNTGDFGYLERMRIVTGYDDIFYSPKVTFDETRNAFLIFYYTSQSVYPQYKRCLAFSIFNKRWDLWEAPDDPIFCTLNGRTQRILLGGYQMFVNYMGGTTKRAYTWHSKVIDAGVSTLRKIWYEIRVKASSYSVGTIGLKDQDSTSIPSIQASFVPGKFVKVEPSSKTLSQGVILTISNASGDCYIDSLGIIYRRKVGAR